MTTLTTKYAVGDAVYRAGMVDEHRQHPCPDCQGSGKWKATSPAGNEYEFGCPRCTARYRSDDSLSLDYRVYVPHVTRLTIGSVRVDTADPTRSPSYMCVETGVGSGSVYYEGDLFLTEEEALRAADIKAKAASATTEWMAKRYDKSLVISDYQLESGALKVAKDASFRARSMLFGLDSLFHEIDEAETLDAVREAVDDYRKYEWESDKAASNEADLSPVSSDRRAA
jgi:hypothetical protein